MPDFVHLHNHTEFSLLDGAAKIADLTDKAANLGMSHIAITDHGNLYGAIEWICKSMHIASPIYYFYKSFAADCSRSVDQWR